MEALRSKIRNYLNQIGAMDGVIQIADLGNQAFLDQMKKDPLIDADEAKRVIDKYMILVKGRIADLRERFIDLYAKYYTVEDIDALLAWHETPVAKKSQAISAEILPQAVAITTDFNNDLLRQLNAAEEELNN